MRTKLVDPGTVRTGRILVVSLGKGNKDPYAPRIVAIGGRDGEGYFLFNNERYPFVPTVGMEVEYIAHKGGPTGIYWKLTREVIISSERWEELTNEVLSGEISEDRKVYLLELLRQHCRTVLKPDDICKYTRRKFLDNVTIPPQ